MHREGLDRYELCTAHRPWETPNSPCNQQRLLDTVLSICHHCNGLLIVRAESKMRWSLPIVLSQLWLGTCNALLPPSSFIISFHPASSVLLLLRLIFPRHFFFSFLVTHSVCTEHLRHRICLHKRALRTAFNSPEVRHGHL